MIRHRISFTPAARDLGPHPHETEVVRLVDPVGAKAFEDAKRQGFLVLGNAVGHRRDPRIGLIPSRAVEDDRLYLEYVEYYDRHRRPLVWVSLVMSGTYETSTGETDYADPVAHVHLVLPYGTGLDDAIRRIQALPGVYQETWDDPGRYVLLVVMLADALIAAAGLSEIAREYSVRPTVPAACRTVVEAEAPEVEQEVRTPPRRLPDRRSAAPRHP